MEPAPPAMVVIHMTETKYKCIIMIFAIDPWITICWFFQEEFIWIKCSLSDFDKLKKKFRDWFQRIMQNGICQSDISHIVMRYNDM